MKSFDEFKESREKMDPSARKMNEHQWEQAYEAYQRVRGRGQSVEESTAEDSRSLPTGRRRSNGGKQTTQLRHLVRGRTAYANERRTVDTLYWVAVAVLVLIFLAQLGTVFTTVMMVRDIGDAPTGGMQSVRVIQWGLVHRLPGTGDPGVDFLVGSNAGTCADRYSGHRSLSDDGS